MGVQNLWELLAPVGRRVSVETLAGKKLAVDASIWMVQFLKAMRDERGEMLRNAHILGFFRRICKLLYLRTKPVFVFDGGTPALKRRTVTARRRQRENARAKIRKTAEKLLLNHLKAKRLEDLAKEIKDDIAREDVKGKKVVLDEKESGVKDGRVLDQESLDEMLAASLAAEEEELCNKVAASGGTQSEGNDEDEELIFLKANGLEELENNIRNDRAKEDAKARVSLDVKGKKVVVDEESGAKGGRVLDQERLDEMLAASLAAEEEELNSGKATATGDSQHEEEDEDDDEDEEMILPATSGNIDPSVLASLPPSMQLDLLVQMRERLMAENRQKYQKIKKTPTKFSELQIQSYLKTVAFRREIDEVQKCAAGRGIGGVQSSRIASEANREYIFSSSFTGDKQMLTPTHEKGGDSVHPSVKKTVSLDSVKRSLFSSQTQTPKFSTHKGKSGFGDDVETYCDDSGRMRVSRIRGLGIRMTRDLQRNLDLMKEFEQDSSIGEVQVNMQSNCTKEVIGVKGRVGINIPNNVSTSNEGNCGDITGKTDTSTQATHSHGSKTAIEISFSEDDGQMKDPDHDFFQNLVSEASTSAFFSRNIQSAGGTNESDSESIWEEGEVDEKIETCLNDHNSEVEWEEGESETLEAVSHDQGGYEKVLSRGLQEEEADVQEAIKRSLQDVELQQSSTNLSAIANITVSSKYQHAVVSHDNSAFEENEVHSSSVATEEKNAKLVVPSAPDDNRTIPHTDEVLEQNVNSDEQSMDISEQAGDLPSERLSRRISREDIAENISNFDLSVRNVLDIIPTNALGDQKQTSQSTHDVRRETEDHCSKKGSSMEEEAKRVDTVQLEEFGNSSSILTAESAHFRGETSTQEELNNQNVVSFNLDEEISLLRQERANLGNEQRKLERNAESVSSEMFAECQELLQMFGLPYIIAPMEAEAQCAYMEISNLVDGVVTDDSDVFLFGARNVYKNIFDDRKYVETYFMKDIESELGLDRETLIRMALLLGSDYTEGVSGIGIVNAIEVVRAFPEEDGLKKFREWIESPDPTILGKLHSQTGNNPMKKSPKPNNKSTDRLGNDAEASPPEESPWRGHDDQPADDISHIKEIFMTKHRNVSKNWHMPSTFPSESVITAYTSPQIDCSTEPFTWGKPDLFLLRKLCWEKLGWDNKKADELIVPVLKEYDKHETQLRLEAFYTFNERFAKIRSKRIKKAVKGITGKALLSLGMILYKLLTQGTRRRGRVICLL